MLKLLLTVLLVVSVSLKTVSSQEEFDCGVPQIVNEMIIKGDSTIRGGWPWHVAIYRKIGNQKGYACGGTLVSKQYVVTAEHCLKNPINEQLLSVENVFVKLGVHRLNSTDGEIQHRSIREIYTPNELPRQDLRNDIAILELARDAVFGKYVHPACVSVTKDLTGQTGTVVGWGVDESDKVSNELKSVRLPVIDYDTCLDSDRDYFGEMLDVGVLCAGYANGSSVCNGDSGGGIFFNENGAWHLGGIVSFSRARDIDSTLCKIDGYGAFTKIHTYLSWIKSITRLSFQIIETRCESKEFDANVNHANKLPQNCGTNYFEGRSQQRATGVFEFPWMAILRREDDSELDVSCAGTLIHKRYVLTTAACTTGASIYHVRLGEHTVGQSTDCNENICAPSVRDYGIECIIRHPNASRHYFLPIWTNDISLVRLERDVVFEDHIRPVCLPVSQKIRNVVVSEQFVTGWNWTASDAPSLIKSITTPTDCQKMFIPLPNKSVCKLQSYGKDICLLSRGSPLGNSVQQNGDRFVQFGVLSTQINCVFSSYVNVVEYMDWILANISP